MCIRDRYKALKEELPKAYIWEDLKDALADRDIDMKFKVSRTTREIQGVKFEHNGFSFSGSKVGREFSYLNIDNRLEENACASLLPYIFQARSNIGIHGIGLLDAFVHL